jgi:hypothetical protein
VRYEDVPFPYVLLPIGAAPLFLLIVLAIRRWRVYRATAPLLSQGNKEN